MSESDELRRLHEADPVKATSIPSAEEPAARALRERIVMEETKIGPNRARTWGAVAAAAVVLAAATAVVLVTQEDKAPSDPGTGPISPGGLAMCVELYTLDTLKDREVAFDGTVVSVDGDRIIFDVGEWFTGGSDPQATLEGAGTIGGITSAGDGLSLEPGTRLLVAGDDGFAWSCGFTQPYDASVAAGWRAALS